jgi:hypothetical protein|tara:strand:+ start:1747 stop:2160 length:414 start_codon:yes stop_codon:yes gene_type:complete
MSSTKLPVFVKTLFENEINKIKINLIKQISKDYSLNEEELIKEYTCNINIINSKMENIEITKKHKYNSGLSKEDRCFARVYNNGKGGQCKRSKNIDDLCTLHNNQFEKNNKLTYGLITENKPSDIFHKKDPKKEKLY